MDNLIKVYDNVIGDDYCDKLIEKFKYTFPVLEKKKKKLTPKKTKNTDKN